MSRYISDSLRQSVKERAGCVCEYCRMSEEDAFYKYQHSTTP